MAWLGPVLLVLGIGGGIACAVVGALQTFRAMQSVAARLDTFPGATLETAVAELEVRIARLEARIDTIPALFERVQLLLVKMQRSRERAKAAVASGKFLMDLAGAFFGPPRPKTP